MDNPQYFIGYLQYLILLLLITGGLLLRIDVRMYQMMQSNREQKAARWLGWINIVVGLVILLGKWALTRYLY